VALDFGARAQDFLKRITPLSADLATHGRTRTLALQKLHRICLAEVRTLKARHRVRSTRSSSGLGCEHNPGGLCAGRPLLDHVRSISTNPL
jgi:hypothetical protein